MVKIGFQQPAAAGLKAEKEAAATPEGNLGAKEEALLPQDGEEEPLPLQSRKFSLSRFCYLMMSLMLSFLGLILTSMYVYGYFSIAGAAPTDSDTIFRCRVIYEDHPSSQLWENLELYEDVKINFEEDFEEIYVPMPHFGKSDPARIVHDFQRRLTAYHDIALDECYVIELNTTIVMAPQSLSELLANMKKESNLPQTYIIQEEMIVTEQIHDIAQLGSFIHHLCQGKETYRLKRRTARRHIHRRAAEKCHHIRHFENTFVVDTAICHKL